MCRYEWMCLYMCAYINSYQLLRVYPFALVNVKALEYVGYLDWCINMFMVMNLYIRTNMCMYNYL